MEAFYQITPREREWRREWEKERKKVKAWSILRMSELQLPQFDTYVLPSINESLCAISFILSLCFFISLLQLIWRWYPSFFIILRLNYSHTTDNNRQIESLSRVEFSLRFNLTTASVIQFTDEFVLFLTWNGSFCMFLALQSLPLPIHQVFMSRSTCGHVNPLSKY